MASAHTSEYSYPTNLLEALGFSEAEIMKRDGDPELSLSVAYILQTLEPIESYVLYAYYFYGQTLNQISTDINQAIMTTSRIRDFALRKFLQPENLTILTYGVAGYYEQELQRAYESGKNLGYRAGYADGTKEGYQKGYDDAVSKYFGLKEEAAANLPKISLQNLALSGLTKNTLKELGITNLSELANAYPDALVKFEGIGLLSGVEISRLLRSYGFPAPLWTDIFKEKLKKEESAETQNKQEQEKEVV